MQSATEMPRMAAAPSTPEERRDVAIKRLKAKKDFQVHLLLYVLVNAMLILVWTITSGGGYFWPIWPMAGWGIGLVMHGYSVYSANTFTEEQIQREMGALR